MKHRLSYYEYAFHFVIVKLTQKLFKKNLTEIRQFGKHKVLSIAESQEIIKNMILSGMPCAIARFGSVELNTLKSFEFDMEISVRESNMEIMQNNAGFFPKTIEAGRCFLEEIRKSIPEMDAQAVWFINCEDYFLDKYMRGHKPVLTYFTSNEPWRNPNNPWSAALEGKKVLVIHPFADTIADQYKKRESLFANTRILPEFHLLTMKAVQTIAGNQDERFDSWFDALDYMTYEALSKEFDIALIGCGAYGYPLAARIKRAGKQAVHMGGALQGLFGIRCKRFDESYDYEEIRRFYNENWVYPSEAEIPANSKNVEGGAYWK